MSLQQCRKCVISRLGLMWVHVIDEFARAQKHCCSTRPDPMFQTSGTRYTQGLATSTVECVHMWKFIITPFNLIYMNLAQNLSELWAEKTIKGKKAITILNKTHYIYIYMICFPS